MYVWRFVLLFLVVSQPVIVIAEADQGSAASCSVPGSNVVSGWNPSTYQTPYQNNPNPFVQYGSRRTQEKSRSTNPWAIPVLQQIPAFPRYFDSEASSAAEFSGSGFAGTKPSSTQTGVAGSLDNSRRYSMQPSISTGDSSSRQKHRYEEAYTGKTPVGNSQNEPYVAPRFSFQQNPRFVTPDVINTLTRQQMQTTKTYPYSRQYSGRSYPANKAENSEAYAIPYLSKSSGWSVSPNELDQERLLYKGDSLPFVPDAAISGLPPMTIFEPLPPVVTNPANVFGTDYGRLGFGPYGDFVQP